MTLLQRTLVLCSVYVYMYMYISEAFVDLTHIVYINHSMVYLHTEAPFLVIITGHSSSTLVENSW